MLSSKTLFLAWKGLIRTPLSFHFVPNTFLPIQKSGLKFFGSCNCTFNELKTFILPCGQQMCSHIKNRADIFSQKYNVLRLKIIIEWLIYWCIFILINVPYRDILSSIVISKMILWWIKFHFIILYTLIYLIHVKWNSISFFGTYCIWPSSFSNQWQNETLLTFKLIV